MKWHWQEEELREHWSLSAEELHLVAGRTDHGRMGFVVMLKFFQYQGRFPSAIKDLPIDVVRFLSQQIGASQSDLDTYDWDGRTATRQRAEILSFLGIRRMTSERMQPLFAWLNDDLLPQNYSLEQLLERVGDWFCELKIAPPSPPQLNRLLRSKMHSFENSLIERIVGHLAPNTQLSINALAQHRVRCWTGRPCNADCCCVYIAWAPTRG